MQGFVAKRVQAVTATEAWTPTNGDKFFCCTVDQGIKINGGTQFDWPAAVPLGIVYPGTTYTFSVSSTILVM
jgi:hypothetical protein